MIQEEEQKDVRKGSGTEKSSRVDNNSQETVLPAVMYFL